MPKLDWAKVGERFYEAGVDRGVLYIGDEPGVAWSGLTSVKEGHSGGESKASYLDGIKFSDRKVYEEFEATIDAYTYPDEFAECDGTKSLGNGLFATQQRRKSFGFSYRTKIGNDLQGWDFAYKIHLIYNALAEPTDREYETLNPSSEPFNFSWKVTTKPPVLDFVPTAHYVIDSRTTPEGLLSFIEDILYGNEDNIARLPDLGELAFLFTSYMVSEFDAGDVDPIFYYTFDGGGATTNQTTTIDAGDADSNVFELWDGGAVTTDEIETYDGGSP